MLKFLRLRDPDVSEVLLQIKGSILKASLKSFCQKIAKKLDLESIGSSLGIDRELIWSSLTIRPGLDNRHLIIRSQQVIKGHRRSQKVMEGHGRSWWWWWVACRIMVSAPVLVPFLWTLDFGFETLDLDLVLRTCYCCKETYPPKNL